MHKLGSFPQKEAATDSAGSVTEQTSHLMNALADVWAHNKQPVDGLFQETHVVVRCDVPKHVDLLREALNMEGDKKSCQTSVKK